MSRATLLTCINIIETELDRLQETEINYCYKLNLELALTELISIKEHKYEIQN